MLAPRPVVVDHDPVPRPPELVRPRRVREERGVLAPAAPGRDARDQKMDFRLGAIAHVVHKRDLGAQVVREAVLAIKKDPQLSTRGRLRRLVRSQVGGADFQRVRDFRHGAEGRKQKKNSSHATF